MDILDAVRVVRNPHRPREDRPLALEINLRRGFDLVAINAAGRFDGRPVGRIDCRAIRLIPFGVIANVCLVDATTLEHNLRDAGEERDVAADRRHEIPVGDTGSEKQTPDVARHLESLEPEFFEWIHHHNLAPATLQFHQGPHETRVVRCRVATDEKNRVALIDIFEIEGCGTTSGDTGQPHPGGLVAVEGAVVDVVGAPEAGDHLQQESGLVTRTSREVKEGSIGTGPLKRAADAVHGLGPLDRPVPIVERS